MFTEAMTRIHISYWIGILSMISLVSRARATERLDILYEVTDRAQYDPKLHPNFAKDKATNVSIQITVRDMYAVSETTMDYSMDIFLRQRWVDKRLMYMNISSIQKVELDVKRMDTVWLPDTYFVNEKRAAVHTVTTPNKLLHIFGNGTVVYSMRISMTLGCHMDFYLYPFDRQKCTILIQSFAYTKDSINLNWFKHGAMAIEGLEMPQFSMEPGTKVTDFDLLYSTGTFSTLAVELVIRRKVGHYFLSVFLPSTLLVMLSWVSFWVDPKAVPARVSLGVTCVLTMTTQSSGTRQSLPPVSYVKMIDIWMFTCLLFVFAALLEFAYVNVLCRSKETTEDDNKTGESKETDINQMDLGGAGQLNPPMTDNRGISQAKRVDNFAKFFFPLSFVLFLVVFALVCILSL